MNQAKLETFRKSNRDKSKVARSTFGYVSHYYRHDTQSDENKYDYFPCINKSNRLVIYVHGGAWMNESLSSSSFLAGYFLSNNFNFAPIGYDLLPTVTMTEMISQVRQAIKSIMANHLDQQHIYVMGHSAGAHLTLSALLHDSVSEDYTLSPTDIDRLSGVVLMSGTYDLRPICGTTLNEMLKLSPTEAWQASPIRLVDDIRRYANRLTIIILVEEIDFVDFKYQSRLLYDRLRSLVDEGCLHFITVEGVDHTTIISRLGEDDYWLGEVVLGLMND